MHIATKLLHGSFLFQFYEKCFDFSCFLFPNLIDWIIIFLIISHYLPNFEYFLVNRWDCFEMIQMLNQIQCFYMKAYFKIHFGLLKFQLLNHFQTLLHYRADLLPRTPFLLCALIHLDLNHSLYPSTKIFDF